MKTITLGSWEEFEAEIRSLGLGGEAIQINIPFSLFGSEDGLVQSAGRRIFLFRE